MPIYEYEPIGFPCTICDERFEVIQEIADDPLQYCPTCGMACRKLVSSVSFKIDKTPNATEAAKKGFTTWRKAGAATWEKVAGPGVDVIQGTPEQVEEIKNPKAAEPVLRIDLDKDEPPAK